MSTHSAEAVIDQFSEYTESAWEQGDLDTLDELFGQDVVVHNVATGVDYEGLDEFKEWITNTRTAFPDFTVNYSDADFVVGENKVASQWEVSGTHEGHLTDLDIEPTGRSIKFEGVTIYELEDGMVTEAWWYFDAFDFLTQLGVIPEDMVP